MSQWSGHTLSKVILLKRLGQGGMAEVYAGHHTTLDRPVAVKILHGFLSEDETLRERFRREAQGVASMRHPHIVQVLDFDVAEQGDELRPYIVMELLQGMPLDDYLAALPHPPRLPPETVARLAMGLASALDYAHGRGIVHRDVKPANIILRRESGPIDPLAPLPPDVEPVLTDFGLARFLHSSYRSASGVISGTPAYLSPEQARGLPVDGRADIYSLGVVLYEMLAGCPPFEAADDDSPVALIMKHLLDPPPPIPDLDPRLQAPLLAALAKEPAQRPQKAGDLALALVAAIFGLAAPPSGAPPLDALLVDLESLVEQAAAYERSLPANNYPARAAVSALSEMARRALEQGRRLESALAPPTPAVHPFSRRELEVLQWAAGGLTNKEIAFRLGISERTVLFHMNSVFNKTATASRTEAVALGMQKGWIIKDV